MRENELRSRLQEDAERLQVTFSEELFHRIMHAVCEESVPVRDAETDSVTVCGKNACWKAVEKKGTQGVGAGKQRKYWTTAVSCVTAVCVSVCLGAAIWSLKLPSSAPSISSSSSHTSPHTSPHASQSVFSHFQLVGMEPVSASSLPLQTFLPDQMWELVCIAAPPFDEHRETSIQDLEKMSVLMVPGQAIIPLRTLAGDDLRDFHEEECVREDPGFFSQNGECLARNESARLGAQTGSQMEFGRNSEKESDPEEYFEESPFAEFWNETYSVISVPFVIFQEE